MKSHVPKTAGKLMLCVYRKILPAVEQELAHWRAFAQRIPNNELRTQASASIDTKRFHCQGGAVFALLAGDKWREAIRFIVAYQTISDYLDNLCDRSSSMDPDDFRLLHKSMQDALTREETSRNYYALRKDQNDGGYLASLVHACRETLQVLGNDEQIVHDVLKLESLYADLQVHKHVAVKERIPRLTTWFAEKGKHEFPLKWYEFSAASGSTLGIFCLISYALAGKTNKNLSDTIYQGYFPYVQGLHILLDYYIDQQEDIAEGDLNFCSYYPDQMTMIQRLKLFINKSAEAVAVMPDTHFHTMICKGLVGLYLADPKVHMLNSGKQITVKLLKESGWKARFFHWNVKMYYRLKKRHDSVPF